MGTSFHNYWRPSAQTLRPPNLTQVATVHCRGPTLRGPGVPRQQQSRLSTARPTALDPHQLPSSSSTHHSPPLTHTRKLRQTPKRMGGIARDKGRIFIPKKLALPDPSAPMIVSDIGSPYTSGPRPYTSSYNPFSTLHMCHRLPERRRSLANPAPRSTLEGEFAGPAGPNPQLCAHQPGEDWQPDFSHVPRHKSFPYLLASVDTFTRWIGAFSIPRDTAEAAATIALQHIIPRFGLPRTLPSDNGPASSPASPSKSPRA